MAQITIGPEFFAKAKNDYADWVWAIVREYYQNSMDAKSSVINTYVDCVDGDTRLIVENDGLPMTEDILIGKLLSLGGSGKDFSGGSVGGFGKAKEILYYSHRSYVIESGEFRVDGCGAQYEIARGSFFDGTRSTVIIDGDYVDPIKRAVHRFAEFAQWGGVLNLNGERLDCNHLKGSRRRDLGFGVVYTNKSGSNQLVVRIGGIPMFSQYCSCDRLVVVELSGRSNEVLTSNRDGLVYPYRGELSNFITELSVDRRSALRDNSPKYERFDGEKFVVNSKVSATPARGAASGGVRSNISEILAIYQGGDCGSSDVTVGGASVGGVEAGGGASVGSVLGGVPFGVLERKFVDVGSEFVIKNESGLVIPSCYRPDSSSFSAYSYKLIRSWGRVLVRLHQLFDVGDSFAVGFLFGDSEAQHEVGPFGRVYYIAPAKIVEQKSSSSKSFKKSWKLTDRGRLITVAAHEFTHGIGYSRHDEDFSTRFTDIMGVVMDNRKFFNWCFK